MSRKRPRSFSTFQGRRVTLQSPKRRRVTASRAIVPYRSAINYRSGGFLGMEKKFLDSSITAQSISSNGSASSGEYDPSTLNCLNAPEQGDTASMRNGRVITLDKINVSGNISMLSQAAQTGADGSTTIMVALVLDKQTNGTQLASELVFKNQSTDTTGAASVFRNLQYAQRFDVLKIWKHSFKLETLTWNGTTMSSAGQQQLFNFSHKFKGLKTNFTGTDGIIDNITDNSLHIIAFATGTELLPTLTYNARLRYYG